MINAVNKMEVGPPEAPFRWSLQITLRCWESDFLVLSVKGKGSGETGSDTNRKDEAIEPPMKCRENEHSVKTSISLCSMDNHSGRPDNWLWGRRHLGGMISI